MKIVGRISVGSVVERREKGDETDSEIENGEKLSKNAEKLRKIEKNGGK